MGIPGDRTRQQCGPYGRYRMAKSAMKYFMRVAMASTVMTLSIAHANTGKEVEPMSDNITLNQVREVSPALAGYMQLTLQDDVWKRPRLSVRDRSIVTVAAVIARNQADAMRGEFSRALDNGVKPGELSEVITHLAFYAGWNNAMSAVAAAHDVYAARGIQVRDIETAESHDPLPLDEVAEAKRATMVEGNFGKVSPGVVKFTTETLFRSLWLRPALAPRDRSLVTFSALTAAGQVAQIPYHLGRAMDNGLTQDEAGEALTQLAFYAGWPNVFSALPVVKGVFEARQK